jgi:hypothetical protein
MLVRPQHNYIAVSQHTDVVTGQAIAKSHWAPWRRARLAAGWKLDLVRVEPTTKLASQVFNVSVPLVNAAIKELEPAVTNGRSKANGTPATTVELLEHHWQQSSDAERYAFVRGRLAELWDRIDRLTR